jgi:segregation and condensation protein A
LDNNNGLQLALMSEALFKAKAFDTDEERFNVTVGEFEGPLDVLLMMARKQKVDLLKISISQLVDQYLIFIKAAQDIRLELAADYLVMAAWLAYLKSALLLPVDEQPTDSVDAETLAMRLQFQIARLDSIRDVSGRLMALPQKNIDFFTRGYLENRTDRVKVYYKDTLYDLLVAYGDQKLRNNRMTYHVRPPAVMSIEEAIARLLPKIDTITDWTHLSAFLPTFNEETPIMRKSVLAGTFVACLEFAKRGLLSIKQDDAYGELCLKSRKGHTDI